MQRTYEFTNSDSGWASVREALTSLNPATLWRAWREAEDAVCVMAQPQDPTPPSTH